ncbi:hypothetical protein LguiA_006300 [Lonicera macranthoides]
MASFSVTCPKAILSPHLLSTPTKSTPRLPNKICCHSRPSSLVVCRSFLNDPTPVPGFQSNYWKQSAWRLHVQLNDVASERSLNSAPIPETKSEAALFEEPLEEVSDENTTLDELAISAFMTEVSDLIKIVDASDIVELELKQLGCELTIRKKEAMEQPPAAAPIYSMQPPIYHSALPPPPQAAAPAATAPPPSAPTLALPAPAAPKPSTSSHPPFKCPMAGTFYRCPAPGEPPFVKVGDKVQKGQVICIIEAMKLMNEIEADQAGTVTEILVDDGKPVSVDLPLFVIVP